MEKKLLKTQNKIVEIKKQANLKSRKSCEWI